MKTRTDIDETPTENRSDDSMMQSNCPVQSVEQVADNTLVLTFLSSRISQATRPGQFINVKVAESDDPLLRRPFSVYRTDRGKVQIIFNVIGRGTVQLSRKRNGDTIDVLGPLGVPYNIGSGDFDTALLVAGGLGVAPMPMTTAALVRSGKAIVTLLGARSAGQITDAYLENVHVATDDGSKGFRGTVVDLAGYILSQLDSRRLKVFGCGPNPMLRALADQAMKHNIPCEVSLEGPMGCGFGICQGCPVELVNGEKQYALMCKEGPVFDVRRIKI